MYSLSTYRIGLLCRGLPLLVLQLFMLVEHDKLRPNHLVAQYPEHYL